LKEEVESCVDATKGSDTWPETAGKEEREKRGQQYPKINSKY